MVFQKWVIKRSNHYAYLGGRDFWWSFFLADSSSCSIDQKHPAAPRRFIMRFLRLPLSPLAVCGPHWRKALRGSFTDLCELPARSRSLPTTRRFAGTHHRLVQQPVGSSPLHISRKKWVNSQPHASLSIGFLYPGAEICNSRKERLLFLWIRKSPSLAIFFLSFFKVR